MGWLKGEGLATAVLTWLPVVLGSSENGIGGGKCFEEVGKGFGRGKKWEEEGGLRWEVEYLLVEREVQSNAEVTGLRKTCCIQRGVQVVGCISLSLPTLNRIQFERFQLHASQMLSKKPSYLPYLL